MYSSYRQSEGARVSPVLIPPLVVLPPTSSSSQVSSSSSAFRQQHQSSNKRQRDRCHLKTTDSSCSRQAPTVPVLPIPSVSIPPVPIPPIPPVPIPPPAISAIITSNRQSVIDRKMRRKAETHKTIPCRAWKDTGRCNYGSRCKFAHGNEDLRRVPEEQSKVFNNPRYRTELCMKYHYLGSCPYGERCSYIHEPAPQVDLEKCMALLSPPLSPEVSRKKKTDIQVANSSAKDASHLFNDWKTSTDAFPDPFSSVDQKEDIELKLLPFMESFLRRPFHIR